MKNKKGISIIVLVITMVVMIIIAGIIILQITGNDLLGGTNQSKISTELSALQDDIASKFTSLLVHHDEDDFTKLSHVGIDNEKYEEITAVREGKLIVLNDANENIKKVAKEMNILAKGEDIVFENQAVVLNDSNQEELMQYRIYGNSYQATTPSIDAPVEIQNVGDLETDSADSNYGKYKIPIKVSGKNLTDFPIDTVLTAVAGETIGWKDLCTNNKIILKSSKEYTYAIQYEVLENTNIRYIVHNAIANSKGGFTYTAFTSGNQNVFTKNSSKVKGVFVQNVTGRGSFDNRYKEYPYLHFRFTVGESSAFGTTLATHSGSIKISNIMLGIQHSAIDYETYEPYVEPITYDMYIDAPLRKVGDTADYIDYINGIVVRNIGVIESYNGETIKGEYISTTGALTTGATVYYKLDKPVYEQEQFVELQALTGTTVISIETALTPSDMKVDY